MLTEHDERRSPRFTYDRGALEVRELSYEHEATNRLINDLIAIVALEWDIEYRNAGSTTFKREDLERGFAPDSCFYGQNAGRMEGKEELDLRIDPPPDAIDPALQDEIDTLLRDGKKIQAIKLLRERQGGLGLKEARDLIDHRGVELGLPALRSGCFIATAAWGDPDAPEVAAFRHYRDRVLSRSWSGRLAIRLYEHMAPPLAALLERSETARALTHRLLVRAAAFCPPPAPERR